MSTPPDTVLIDAHVHLYACHDLAACLDHARANFAHSGGVESPGVLLLCEMSYEDRFVELAGFADRREAVGRWRIERTSEEQSLLARDEAGGVLVVIAGRQIITSDGLEVLALCTTHRFDDRVPIERAIVAARAGGALVVLPYGVGKWSGRRGRIIEAIVRRDDDEPLLLGDNGNRLAFGPTPRLLRHAARHAAVILPGSDPLPLPGQERRVGSYGLVLPLHLDLNAPARQLRATLAGLHESPSAFGRLSGLWTFLQAQLAMQLRKRRRP